MLSQARRRFHLSRNVRTLIAPYLTLPTHSMTFFKPAFGMTLRKETVVEE
jgi:hypothetical protein